MARSFLNVILLVVLSGGSVPSICQAQSTRSSYTTRPGLFDFRDYIRPTMEFGDALLELTQKYRPSYGSNTSVAVNAHLLVSLFFGVHHVALERKYTDAVKILLAEVEGLPPGYGQLSYVTYTKDDAGIPDVTSLRIAAKGIGRSPQESYVFGTSNMTVPYEMIQFTNVERRYLWIQKDSGGITRCSQIVEPFIDAFQREAFKLREHMLEGNANVELSPSDEERWFHFATTWAEIAQEHRELLERKRVWNEVEKLNKSLRQKQDQMNELSRKYDEAERRKRNMSTMENFINACESINRLFSVTRSEVPKQNIELYEIFQKQLSLQQQQIWDRRHRLVIDAADISFYLRNIYTKQKVATPNPPIIRD